MHTEFFSKNGNNLSDFRCSFLPFILPGLLPLSALPFSSINARPSPSLTALLKCHLFWEAFPVPLVRMSATPYTPLNLSRGLISSLAAEGCSVPHSINDQILKYVSASHERHSCVEIETMDFGARLPVFKSQHCRSLAVGPWANSVTSYASVSLSVYWG